MRLTGDERVEAEQREAEARVWISGLEAVKEKLGVRAVYDLSATPFFLRGSGYPEGTLFPWVVSDFSVIDAIESGIVKIPRVPVAGPTSCPASSRTSATSMASAGAIGPTRCSSTRGSSSPAKA
jgi:hypothetical protein